MKKAIVSSVLFLLALATPCLAGNVGTVDLLDGAVTTTKIADGAVTSTKLAPSAVTTAAMTDGAVTDAKISGLISGAKLGSHGHNQSDVVGLDTSLAGKADITHNHDAQYQGKYANVVVVAKSGGNFKRV